MPKKFELKPSTGTAIRMNAFIAAAWLFVTPAFGQEQVQNRDRELVTPAARSINWSSASALNALFKDNGTVKRFMNEVTNDGDPSDLLSGLDVFDHRFVDLDGDGWLELVALVSGDRPGVGLEVVFQTPGGVPPTDRLATTYEGFVFRELGGRNVADLNEVLRDLDGDGTPEIVIPQAFGEIVGAAFPQTKIPEVFAWKNGDYVNVSARHSKFYRNEILPQLERQLHVLDALPAPEDPSERTARRADREKVVREIAEARKRATQK